LADEITPRANLEQRRRAASDVLIAPSENDQQPEMALTEYKLNYLWPRVLQGRPGAGCSAAHPYPDTVINAMIGAIEAKLGTPSGERIQNMQVVDSNP